MNEHSKTDRVLLRSKDLALIISVIVLAGYAFTWAKKTEAWDTAVEGFKELAPVVNKLITDDQVNLKMNEIIIQRLERIEKKLDEANGR